MAEMRNLNSRIVETLYIEALVLSDEVRGQFEQARGRNQQTDADDLVRVALSCEALRATTRVLQCLAWLLNHRAFCAGEMTELQLRMHCPLLVPVAPSDPENEVLLPGPMADLVHESEQFYDRIVRLDEAWRTRPEGPGAIDGLRDRLARALASGSTRGA